MSDCTRFPSLLTDDVGGHHAAAGADIRQLSERQTRERRTDFTIEQERVEINDFFGKLDSSVICQRGKSFAGSWHAFLHEIIAVRQCIINRFVPAALVNV